MIMKDLLRIKSTLDAEIQDLRLQCRAGDHVAAGVVAYCGARCSQLLVEVSSKDSLGKQTVCDAAEQATRWPIAYPALDDGRTNRIKQQVPIMLGRRLKLRVNKPKGTGMDRTVHPEVRTFLEEALRNVGPDGRNHGSQSNRASIMAALIVLFRMCIEGNCDAVGLVAECGVELSELLTEHLLRPSESSLERMAVEEAARNAPEWPTVFYATKKGTHYFSSVRTPPMLGARLGFEIKKPNGTKSDREFGEDRRVGFALTYLDQLRRGRHLAKIYRTPRNAFWWELARQGHAAWLVLLQLGWSRLNFFEMVRVDVAIKHGITNSLLEVVPLGLGKIWKTLPHLPDFGRNTVEVWTNAAMAFAEAKCGGDWADGPWPENLKTDAEARVLNEGTGEVAAYEEAVGLWMTYGFQQLARAKKGKLDF